MKMRISNFLVLFFTTLSLSVFGQTGPAGVGNFDGSSGQSENIIWLDASTLGLADGAAVTTWTDLSGNGNDLVQQGGDPTPLFETNGLFSTNHNTVRFDGTERYLVLGDNADLDNALGGITIIAVVYNATLDGAARGIYSKRVSSGSNRSYNSFTYTSSRLNFDIDNGSNRRLASGAGLNTTTDYISTNRYSGSLQEIYLQSVQSASASISGNITNSNSNLILGALNNNYGTYFDGDIAELIFYREGINDGERLIVENYLSQKYGITITNDFFGTDAGFDAAFVNDFMGIGTGNGTDKFSTSAFSDALQISEANGSLNSSNEFIMMAHDNTTHADGVTANIVVSADLTSRWDRSWFLEATGDVSAEMRFDFGTAGLAFSGDASDYVLLYRATTADDYTRILANSYAVENGDQLVVDLGNLTLPSGYYTVGEGTQLVAGDWYSFQSGDWTDPETWTTISDGSLREPVLGGVPTSGDNVTILSGRTVTMDTDDNDGITLEVNGRLDIVGTSGHNFFSIEGNGVISLEGDGSSDDNFPSGNTSLFADPVVGGTVEILGSGVNLNTSRSYNNMLVSLDGGTDVATMLADYTINGDLTISNGILRINDNSATTAINLTANGNVQIDAAGELNVGTANARHEFNFYGDFINSGTAEFTNRVATNYGAEATDGIVDANFLSGTADQTVDCNGVTNFYRIEINKGVDQTYILDINASSAANFNLFGPGNYNHGSTDQLTTNDNNLGLLRGTVRLNTNVDVPVLNNTGNYNISEAARLWVNGGSAEKPGGTAIVPYGTIQISDGILNAPINSGITTRANGNIVVEGGILTVNQIRTSVLGTANIGGYTQSGGEVNITGQNISTSYYAFSLTYPGNTFNMSGGTLTVAGAPTGANTGGIFIASDESNQNVTGGTVIMEIDRNNDYKLTSLSPFWNVIMRYTSGSGSEVDLINGSSGTGGNVTTITSLDLRVLNDLTIEDGIAFDHNGFDVEVGSDFTVQATGDYIFDDAKHNTLTLNGVDNATMSLLNVSGGSAAKHVFYNLIIDKPHDKTVSLASSKTGANLESFENNLFRVDGEAFKVLSGTLDQGQHSILANCDSVVNYDVLTVYNSALGVSGANDVDAGFNGNNDQFKLASNQGTPTDMVFITADTAVIGNLKYFMQTFVVNTTSDLTIQFLEHSNGRLDIADNNLKVQFYNEAPGQGFQSGPGLTDMIVTDGNASDGGLSLYVSANQSITYPFGIGLTGVDPTSKYTPADATITGFSDDGYINIRPVDGVLGTTDPAGGDVLSYYWKVEFEDFTINPTVEYQFNYNEDDLDGSVNEATFVAGKVLDGGTYERRFEDDNTTGVPGVVQNEGVNSGTNIITFNGDADTGFVLEAANYTAGQSARFVGAPSIYYSRNRASGQENWNNPLHWSTDAVNTHLGGGGTGSEFPQAGDIAVIGYNSISNADFDALCNPCTAQNANSRHDININGITADVAELIFDSRPVATSFNNNNSRIRVFQNATLNAGVVSGHGTLFEIVNNSDRATITGDFGNFTDKGKNGWFFWNQGTDVLLSNRTEYPTLRLFDGTTTSLVNDVSAINLVVDSDATLRVTHNIAIDSLVRIGLNQSGNLLFPDNSGSNVTLSCDSLYMSSNAANNNNISVENAGTDLHTMSVRAGILIDEVTVFDLSSSGTNVILELTGEGNHAIENNTGVIPDLYQIKMNKGNSQSNSFSFDEDFTISTPTASIQPIVLENGTLILNDAGIGAADDLILTNAANNSSFNIPSSAGLQISAGKAILTGTDIGITLDGLLIIDGTNGELDMSGGTNNFIEYSASGNSILEISDGVLTVGSQIRPITSANTGVLKYRQTGGDVRIGTHAAPESTRGMLQIYNPDSEFTYTGGTLTIERHQTSPTIAALYLDPATSDVTGSTITIFNGNTPAAQSDFRINSTIALENLTINGTNSPIATLNINPLTINSQLSIAANATLLGDARTLTVGGDMDNDGTYDAEGNETIFNTSTGQSITGSGTNTFFKFTKQEAGTLTLTNSIDVADLFTITEGTVDDGGNNINLAADAVIDGTHLSVGGNGLVFAGAANQELRRSTSGTGTIGMISINNANDVTIPDGNGYDFNITNGLRLEDGLFQVGGGSILLGTAAEITPVNPFSVTNMIQTNSSFVDSGIGKQFPANYTTDFTFPVGQAFYTPVSLDFGAGGGNTFGTTAGTLVVRPADEYHPTVNDGVPDGALGGTDDINNVLQYYWTVEASDVTGMNVDMTLSYDQSHVLTDAPGFDETDYIAARILSVGNPTYLINKFTNAEVDDAANLVMFNFSGAGSNAITGDYFAGIDEAIPDNVATYTVDVDGGNVGDDVYVEAVPGGGAPTGAVVIIPNGLTLSLDEDNIRFYATEIQDGGVLEVDNTTNHRLGELTGTGTLRIVSHGINANLPAFSGDFLSCSGGGLEYAGTGSYSILSGITTIRNLTLSDSGDRNFPNNDIVICEDFIINGPDVNCTDNRRLDILNSLTLNSGTLNAPSGSTSRVIVRAGNTTINAGGVYNGGSSGFSLFFNDVIINGGTFNIGSANYGVFIGKDLTMLSGSFDGGTGSSYLELRNFASVSSDITGNFTGGNSFNNLYINKSVSSTRIGLNNSIEVINNLRLTSGIIDNFGNNVVLGANIVVTPSTGSSSSYINGNVQKTMTNIGDDFIFPIGSTSLWRPATVNNVSSAGLTWGAEYFAENPTNDPLVDNITPTNPGTIATVSGGEYWKITDDEGTAPVGVITATVGLSWGFESDVSTISSEREELEVMIWNDGISSWDNLGGTTFSGGHVQTGGSFIASSTNTFSEQIFTLGSGDVANALPITLESFTGYAENNVHHLEWVTSSEINNDYFELQRSLDGLNYEVLTTIEGAGTTSDIQSYSYMDVSPVFGKNYYRLVQVDIDGERHDEGDIILLENKSQLEKLDYKLYPNPTDRSNVNLEISSPDKDRDMIVSLYDLQGRRYYKEVLSSDRLFQPISIKMSNEAKSGMYIVIVEQGDLVVQKKLLVQ